MSAEELRDVLKQQPFEPFRLVMSDGEGFDVRHPDLLLIGQRSAMVGLTGQPGQIFYERVVKVDLRHVIRLEPLESAGKQGSNGAA